MNNRNNTQNQKQHLNRESNLNARDISTLDANKAQTNSRDHYRNQERDFAHTDEDETRIESNWTEVCKTFDAMGLSEGLLRGIYGCGYETPSAIQQIAILPILTGRDTIAQAQSGTGKTATFSISVLQQIDVSESACQAVPPPPPVFISALFF
jgi:superfamily II DNA/RNA helicase